MLSLDRGGGSSSGSAAQPAPLSPLLSNSEGCFWCICMIVCVEGDVCKNLTKENNSFLRDGILRRAGWITEFLLH